MIQNAFREILFFFDKVIYGFIPTVYDFIMKLASISEILDEGRIAEITTNIYALIGLYAMFRIAIVLLNAIIDPEKFNDKQAGVSKIFTKFIVALCLIVAIPVGFSALRTLQQEVINNHIIEKVLIGQDEDAEFTQNYGNYVSKAALSSFLTCSEAIQKRDSTAVENNQPETGICTRLDNAFTQAFTPVTGPKSFDPLDEILNDKSKEADPNGQKSRYNYQYNSLISTAAGIFILVMLISICIDVAVRLVKLAFLEVISPIAVMGYVDPKGQIFKEWLKMTFKTYINLFISIASVSFVTSVFTFLNLSGEGLTYYVRENGQLITKTFGGVEGTFAKIFIIIGLLIFAKKLPEMLSQLFNLKEGGMGSLNPFKKLGGMVGAGVVGGATALALKPVAGAVGGLGGGLAARMQGGRFRSGFVEGAAKGAGGVSMKGGVGNLGKQLTSVAKGWRQGSNAGAKLVTGKDTKTGLLNSVGEGIMEHAGRKQHEYANARTEKIGGNLFASTPDKLEKEFSPKYNDAMNKIDKAKEEVKKRNAERQYYYNRFQQNPDASFNYEETVTDQNTGLTSTVTHSMSYRDAYNTANSNYNTAEKYLENAKTSLSEMEKLPEYSSDMNKRIALDAYKQAHPKPITDIPPSIDPPNVNPNNNNNNGGNP
jgi:hypothetical protein